VYGPQEKSMISSHLSSFWFSYFVERTNFVLLASHYGTIISPEKMSLQLLISL